MIRAYGFVKQVMNPKMQRAEIWGVVLACFSARNPKPESRSSIAADAANTSAAGLINMQIYEPMTI